MSNGENGDSTAVLICSCNFLHQNLCLEEELETILCKTASIRKDQISYIIKAFRRARINVCKKWWSGKL